MCKLCLRINIGSSKNAFIPRSIFSVSRGHGQQAGDGVSGLFPVKKHSVFAREACKNSERSEQLPAGPSRRSRLVLLYV